MSAENIKKFELKLGRNGIVITVVGMAVLLCGSFILGVSVGKNIDTYPEKISSTPQRILAFFWRPAKVAGQQSASENKETGAEKGNMDLAFHNTLTHSKTLPIQPAPVDEKTPEKDVVIDQKAVAPPPVAPEASREEEIAKKEETVAHKDASAERSAVEQKTKKKDASAASVAAGPSYFIHVASLKDKGKADQINKSVTELGYKSKVVKTDIKGKGIWYRVIATGFDSKTKAKAAVDKITRKVKTTCIIRQTGADMDKN